MNREDWNLIYVRAENGLDVALLWLIARPFTLAVFAAFVIVLVLWGWWLAL